MPPANRARLIPYSCFAHARPIAPDDKNSAHTSLMRDLAPRRAIPWLTLNAFAFNPFMAGIRAFAGLWEGQIRGFPKFNDG